MDQSDAGSVGIFSRALGEQETVKQSPHMRCESMHGIGRGVHNWHTGQMGATLFCGLGLKKGRGELRGAPVQQHATAVEGCNSAAHRAQ
eukprot:1104472-Pyramimonas_sp.AAC.1